MAPVSTADSTRFSPLMQSLVQRAQTAAPGYAKAMYDSMGGILGIPAPGTTGSQLLSPSMRSSGSLTGTPVSAAHMSDELGCANNRTSSVGWLSDVILSFVHWPCRMRCSLFLTIAPYTSTYVHSIACPNVLCFDAGAALQLLWGHLVEPWSRTLSARQESCRHVEWLLLGHLLGQQY